eukprot:TRINITY_DN53677_c0_g1_i1.p1 TRINITY_DN53677_c0_g1~~TRINITY_DN53677_c0_g1_i1.p1  ORF type:complete len:128 (-),score=26.15 TRINITY_DN53677_c0_g1_i1:156-539(-)
MEKIAEEFADVAAFKKVYVSEAHPTDEWKVYSQEYVDYCQPKTLEERSVAASKLQTTTNTKITLVLDNMENEAEKLYAAHPERIYVIDQSKGVNTVAFKGGMGPFGYHPEELREFLQAKVANKPVAQ